MLPKLTRIREGATKLFIPSVSLEKSAPDTFPVFFNPAARINRDISVAVASATNPRNFLDALTGVGARGVRIANETGVAEVSMTDFNKDSLAVARKNVRENGLKNCSVMHKEANGYLYSRFDRGEKFEAVDVDPFGSPAPYAQAAVSACSDGAVLSLTATDAAVLCGVYPEVSLRRYGALAVKSEFMHETGIRILLGFAARMAGIWDIGLEPAIAHSTLHYMRVYLRVRRGASNADEATRNLGYVTQCNGCYSKWAGSSPSARCAICNTRVRSAGPLWVGKVIDEGLATAAKNNCATKGWDDAETMLSGLSCIDRFPPFCHSVDRTCSRLKVPSTSSEGVMLELTKAGFGCTEQPFESGIKTDATYEEFVAAVETASRPTQTR